jgi:hypothetical protein
VLAGPIIVGGVGFFTKVLDRLQQSKDRFVFNDQPLYLELTVPAGVALAYVMGIIEYHPPNYQIAFLLPGSPVFAGTAGSTTPLGPFPRGNSDPDGKYAWRIGLMALVCDPYGCRWYWGQHVQYYDFSQIQICPAVCPANQQCDPATGTCVPKQCPVCTAGQQCDSATGTCVPKTCTAPCTHLDPNTNTCVSTCSPGQQCDLASNQCYCSTGQEWNPDTRTCTVISQPCSFGMEWDPTSKTCAISPTLIMGVVAVLVAIGILAVFFLTRRKPSPPAPAYKPYPAAPAPVTLKPGAPQAMKPGPPPHVPRVVARREEEKK